MGWSSPFDKTYTSSNSLKIEWSALQEIIYMVSMLTPREETEAAEKEACF